LHHANQDHVVMKKSQLISLLVMNSTQLIHIISWTPLLILTMMQERSEQEFTNGSWFLSVNSWKIQALCAQMNSKMNQ